MYKIIGDYIYTNGKVIKKELNPKAYQPLPKSDDPYWLHVNGVCKTILKREAKQTIAEWEEIDAEMGEKHKYELVDLRKKKIK